VPPIGLCFEGDLRQARGVRTEPGPTAHPSSLLLALTAALSSGSSHLVPGKAPAITEAEPLVDSPATWTRIEEVRDFGASLCALPARQPPLCRWRALPGADVLHRVHPEGTEDYVVFEERPATEEIVYDVDVAHVAGLRLVSDTVEFLDKGGRLAFEWRRRTWSTPTASGHRALLLLRAARSMPVRVRHGVAR
jgi:hypothetical protein